jgi:hypothetical protein
MHPHQDTLMHGAEREEHEDHGVATEKGDDEDNSLWRYDQCCGRHRGLLGWLLPSLSDRRQQW